jgi:membrane protease YdiL (CAAX protease family)
MSFNVANLVGSLELVAAAIGAILLWRVVVRPAARALRSPPALTPWNATIADFFIFVFFVVGGAFIAAAAASFAAKAIPLRGDAMTVFTGAGAQVGMFAGVCLYWYRAQRAVSPSAPQPGTSVVKAGATTFLIALPLLLITATLWKLALVALDLPTERQSLIDMFRNAESPLMLAVLIGLAVVVAPVTEELVFRAGLFRFLRSRAPRWLALLASGLLFASLHVNWVTLEGLSSFIPLLLLAVIFSLAYEQTGRIGTAIVAHALFNLNTIVLIFAGVGL